jgi:hypothetical protein
MNNVSSSGVHIQETGVENMNTTELKNVNKWLMALFRIVALLFQKRR